MPAVRHEDVRDELLAGLGEEGRRHYEAFGAIYEARQLAGRLAELRAEADLTQRQAAKLAGVDQADLSRIESGQVVPSLPTLLRLLDAVGGTLVVTSRRRSPTAPTASRRRQSGGTATHEPREADPRRGVGSTRAVGRQSA
jgi:transcriptional regulator with XRE-family HTH domain